MAGLQRSEVSFRRQGSSGLVWDDRLLSGELNHEGKPKKPQEDQEKVEEDNKDKDQHATTSANRAARDIPPIETIQRSRSNGVGGRGYRTGRVSPAVDPPSPKVSACGFCSAFGKESKINARTKPAKRRSR